MGLAATGGFDSHPRQYFNLDVMYVFYVYALQSAVDDGFYVGITSDVQRRLREHNSGRQRSTKARRPFELVYSESCATRSEAQERERFWKSGQGRERLSRSFRDVRSG